MFKDKTLRRKFKEAKKAFYRGKTHQERNDEKKIRAMARKEARERAMAWERWE